MPNQPAKSRDQLRSEFLALKTPHDVAALLGYQYRFLVRVLYRTPDAAKYTSFDIPKRRGGKRTIDAPNPYLKAVQRRLSAVLYAVHRPRSSAHGFLRARGIVSNASRHFGRRHVGNVDLENFFGSINFGRVRGLFRAKPYGLPEPVATVLAQICCHNNALPQGAPTSPIVSNMLANSLDRELERLAKKYRCHYSRYADDLTFSTRQKAFPGELLASQGEGQVAATLGSELAAALHNQGFRPNPAKVRLAGQYVRQEVTGLVVNEKVNIRREFIRQLRAMIHALGKFGVEAATTKHYEQFSKKQYAPDVVPPDLAKIVAGKLEFVRRTIGEENPVYLNLLRRYCTAVGLPPPAPAAPEATLISLLGDSVWVLECDFDIRQGTGFMLEGVGLVTCSHVVGTRTKAFLPSAPDVKFLVKVIKQDELADVAILRLVGDPPRTQALVPAAEQCEQLDPLTVCGFGGYNEGDTLNIKPVVVSGFRRKRGLPEPRLLLNSGIVAGMSGGPVLNARHEVVGLAVTGAGREDEVDRADEHGVVPIATIMRVATEAADGTPVPKMAG